MHAFHERVLRYVELMHRLQQLALILLITCAALGIQAQDPITWSITSNENLPSNIVYRITQDQQGQTWIATDNGICYYDGNKVVRPILPEVNDNFFAFIDKDIYGHIWMLNISGELLVYKNGEIHNQTSSIKTNGQYLNDIYLIENYLWTIIKDDNRQNKVQVYKIDEDGELNLINDDLGKLKSLYLAISKYNDKVYISYTHSETRLSQLRVFKFDGTDVNSNFKVNENFSDIIQTGQRYIATDQDRFNLILFDENKTYDKIEFKIRINQLIEISGKLFVLTNKGYHQVYIKNSEISLSRPFLSQHKINSIFYGRENLYWFGTYNKGVQVMPSIDNTLYKLKGEQESTITELTEVHSKILAGTSNGEVLRLENEKLEEIANFRSKITGINSYKSSILIGTSEGLQSIKKGNSNPIPLSTRVIKDLDVNEQSDEIIISSGIAAQLLNINGNSFQPSGTEINERSYACLFDNQENIWVGTVRGLYLLNHDSRNGNQEHEVILPYNISDIVELNDSTVYASTFSNGAFEFVNNKKRSKLDLPKLTIVDMSTDGEDLLFATDQGALYYDIENEDYFPITNKNFISSNDVQSVHLTEKWLWIGTDAGLNKINRRSISIENDILLSINNIFLDQQKVAPDQPLEIEKSVNSILFQYTGISNKNHKDISYQYRVKGLDSGWTSTKSDELYLRKLEPGNYTLELHSTDGRSESNMVSKTFTIKPDWYDHTWVKLLMALVITFLIYHIIRYLLSKRLQEERAKAEKQKVIDGMQMTALQNHMNPHFISNALYTIHDLIKQEKNWEASEFTSNFAGLIRKSMKYASKERINLKEELEFLHMYLELESSRFDIPVVTTISVDEKIKEKQNIIFIPPLLIQPLIENSFKHGDLSKRENPKVSVQVKSEGTDLKVLVCDNGLGFDPGSLQNSSSTGIKTLKERLAINTSQLQKEKIKDLLTVEQLITGECCVTIIISYLEKHEA